MCRIYNRSNPNELIQPKNSKPLLISFYFESVACNSLTLTLIEQVVLDWFKSCMSYPGLVQVCKHFSVNLDQPKTSIKSFNPSKVALPLKNLQKHKI